MGQKTYGATRISEKIDIDGKMDDPAWAPITSTGNFTTWQPTYGKVPVQDASIKMAYDDEALYIAAFIPEVSRDSIMMQLTQRDDIGNTDWFGVIIDTYQNGTDGFEFIVGSTGVQFDAKIVINQGEDTDWDAVWFSEVHLGDDGWGVEFMIPYSAIRFPGKQEQQWNINFIKQQARTGEKSTWNPIDPTGQFFLTQFGTITNIKDIEPPIRLSFSPYVSLYALNSQDPNRDPVSSTGYSYNGGLDIKYGINDAFTLDMTLIPDFGQVQSDPLILNLSPFEVQFSENRPFFTEGVEIFGKGDLFYSRRVGGFPIGFGIPYSDLGDSENVVANPQESQLLNATKISGRTNGGLGIGFFNALSSETIARIEDSVTGGERVVTTAPLTNYNVVVLDQNLKNNSSFAFVNTNVTRFGEGFYDSNVSGIDFSLKNEKQRFGIRGDAALSQLYYSNEEKVLGTRYNIGLEKLTGNLTYGLYYGSKSRNFNINDLGFNTQTNVSGLDLSVQYGLYDEFWKHFQRADVWINLSYSRLNNPSDFTGLNFNAGFWTQTKNFWNYNMWFNLNSSGHDYFEPRSEGRYWQRPGSYNGGFWFGTDDRKAFRMSASVFAFKVNEDGRYGYGINTNPRFRFSDQLTLSLGLGLDKSLNNVGWVDDGRNDEIYFGLRDRVTWNNRISADYNFSSKMGFMFRLRHYWDKVIYNSYHELEEDGSLVNANYNEFNNISFSQFNIDLTYRWRFAPGSDIFIVWKNNITGVQRNKETNFRELNYTQGISALNTYPQNNSISIRLVYFLDYLRIKNSF